MYQQQSYERDVKTLVILQGQWREKLHQHDVKHFTSCRDSSLALSVALFLPWAPCLQQALRQAQTEWLLWQAKSQFPFCQLVTDLRKGAVAYYADTVLVAAGEQTVLVEKALPTMTAVWEFLRQLVIDAVRCMSATVRPPPLLEEFDSPRRVKPKLDEPVKGSTASVMSPLSRKQWLWQQLAAIKADADDIGCMRDLDCFDVVPYPKNTPYHS
jgi:hypothetical protein